MAGLSLDGFDFYTTFICSHSQFSVHGINSISNQSKAQHRSSAANASLLRFLTAHALLKFHHISSTGTSSPLSSHPPRWLWELEMAERLHEKNLL
jgi:hypothetical protein